MSVLLLKRHKHERDLFCIRREIFLTRPYIHTHTVSTVLDQVDLSVLFKLICLSCYYWKETNKKEISFLLEEKSLLHTYAVCCSVLQCVAVCCSVLQCVAVGCRVLQLSYIHIHQHRVLQHVAVCCSLLQSVAVCCSLLQCATHCHTCCRDLSYIHIHSHAHFFKCLVVDLSILMPVVVLGRDKQERDLLLLWGGYD